MRTLIQNGIVHDGVNTAEKKDLLLEDGKIIAVGGELSAKEIIDASNKHILPGFIDPLCHWGVNGNGTEIRSMGDDNDEASAPIYPELSALYALNGRALSLQQLYAFGITCIGVSPSNKTLFGGTVCVFETNGINPYKMVVKENAAMKASVCQEVKTTFKEKGGPQTDMKIFSMLEEQLRLAKEYDPEAKDAKRDEKMLALKRLLNHELPLIVTTDTATDIRHVEKIIAPYHLEVIYVNTNDIHMDDSFLADQKRTLILPWNECDAQPKTYGTDYDAIYALSKQGMNVALATGANGWQGREDLLWNAADMMKSAKDSDHVLKMLTVNPAKLLGIADRKGCLLSGYDGDLVIWSDDPLLTFQAEIEQTLIQGHAVYRKGDDMRCYL